MNDPSTWPEVTIRDLCSAVQYGYTASASVDVEGPRFLRITDIVPGYVDWAAVPRCEILPADHRKFRLEDGDIVVARTGATVGYGKLLRDPPDAVFASYLVRFRVKPEIESRFIGSIVESAAYKAWVKAQAGGAAQPNANAQVLTAFPLRLPPLEVQRRIASILGAYDDLIEVNRRRISLLEEMARRLFEEWFVHRLIPGEIEFSNKPLGEVAEVQWGDTQTTKASYIAEGYVAYSASGPDGFMDHYDHQGLGIVLSAIGAQCGKIWLADGHWSCIKNTIYLKAKPQATTTRILYLALNRPEVWPKRGAAQPFISQGDAKKIIMSLPPFRVQERFDQLVAPILDQVRCLRSSSQVLAKSRDLLLPGLISGELSVAAAERELEAAA